VVHRRLQRRRALTLGAVFLVYLGGTTTGYLLSGGARLEEARVQPVAPQGDAGAGRPIDVEDVPLPADPRDLEEQLATVSPGERSRLLRQAGNGYISARHSNPEAALYCYRRLLSSAPPSPAEVPDVEDSWLLKYLKLAHQ
jgi:hypothetical protein